MEFFGMEVAVVTLDICEAVPDVVAVGMTSGCIVVLAAGLLVGCFKTFIKIMGGR